MSWYVVATKPNGERSAEANLSNQGYEIFLPVIEKTRRHARRTDIVRRPLFPGYLFVQFDPSTTAWRAINGTIGVRHLLMNNGRPQSIYGDFIKTIKLRISASGVIAEDPPVYKEGETVELISGAMQGHLATILSADENCRIKILLAMMGGEVISTIAAADIKKAG